MISLICKICGMKINEKNLSFNANSFIEKNSDNKILFCPFCGVGEMYLTINQNEVMYIDTKLDSNTMSILDKAMKLEVFNGEFYTEASKMAKEQKIKDMFLDLSNIEFMHAKIHQRLGNFDKLPKLIKPDYSRFDTDKALILEANKRENHAVEFYFRNIDKISNNTVKIFFKSLSDVESDHIKLLAE